VACSSSPSTHKEPTEPPKVDASTGDEDTGTVVAPPPVDSGVDVTVTTPTVDSGSGSGSDSGSGSGSSSDSGSSSGSGSGSSTVVDAGHDVAAPPPPKPCAGPNGCYTFAFKAVTTDPCGFLVPPGIGFSSPFTTAGNDLLSVNPQFCATTGDVGVESMSSETADSCSASATWTCSDAVPATIPDGGTDPATYVAVSTVTSNTDGTLLTGTLTLTETDEVNKGSCSEKMTFTATLVADTVCTPAAM
jgi:hypothetical protein